MSKRIETLRKQLDALQVRSNECIERMRSVGCKSDADSQAALTRAIETFLEVHHGYLGAIIADLERAYDEAIE